MSAQNVDESAGAEDQAAVPASAVANQRLSGRLGTTAIIFMVLAGAAPLLNVAGVVPIGIAFGNGAAYPAAYLVATVVLLFFAVGFTAMTKYVEDAGAFYSYVAKGLGRSVGSGTAFLALATYIAVYLAVLGYVGAASTALIQDHGGPEVPWLLLSIIMLALVALLGYRNVELSGRVLAVLLGLEIVVVALVSLVVLVQGGGPEGMSSSAFSVPSFFEGAPGIALIFATSGFIGFEATAIFRDEAVQPEVTIPRATFGALLLIGAFYFVGAWALASWWGDGPAVDRALADPGTMYSESAGAILGSAFEDVIEALLVTSLLAALLTFHNVISRYLHALARQGDLPKRLSHTHSNHLSPHVASIVTSTVGLVAIVVCAAAGLDPVLEVFTWFAGIGTIGILMLMLITSVAVVAFFGANRGTSDVWRGLVAPTLGCVGLIGLLVLGLDQITLLVGGSPTLAACLLAALSLSFVAGLVIARTDRT